MQILSHDKIVSLIRDKQAFECLTEDSGLQIKISDYAPYIGTAIHSGSRLRKSLIDICNLTPAERFYEEDPITSDFISSLPITLTAMDSRYEYDLNRKPAECIYEIAWGIPVWNSPLSDEERAISLKKHFNYYSVFKVLAEVLETLYGYCVIYDLHGYNYKRITRQTPVFNIGTHFVNKRLWRTDIHRLSSQLSAITLPNMTTGVGINEVFSGKGYQAEFCRTQLKNTLCIPLEVKKIYMDEETGDIFPLVIEQLKAELKTVIFEHISVLANRKTRTKRISAKKLLGSTISSELRQLDMALYSLTKNLSTLSFINPINVKAEEKRFLKRPHDYQPHFRYRQVNIDPYRFKEQLYSLPVHKIQDAEIELLYKRVIEQMAMRVDLLANIGSVDFLYNSLRYYGQPSDEDLKNAEFILHAKEHDAESGTLYSGVGVIEQFKQFSDDYGIKCKISGSDNMVAGAIVEGLNLKINSRKQFRRRELSGLIEHEVGIHLVTSANARLQPLQVFKIGLPGNTHTQEGLAILSEHLTGNISVSRLKTLALRVICVHKMLHGASFNELFFELTSTYKIAPEKAFSIVTRVFRGGGFTKDYLYLSGLKQALRLVLSEDLKPLLVGKTAFEFLPLLQELISREIVKYPSFLPNAFKKDIERDPILDYLISSIH